MARENAFELFSFRSASSKCQFIHSVWKHHNKLWHARARLRRHWIEQFHFNSFVVVIFSFIKRKFRNKIRRKKNVENIFHSFVGRKRVKKSSCENCTRQFFYSKFFFFANEKYFICLIMIIFLFLLLVELYCIVRCGKQEYWCAPFIWTLCHIFFVFVSFVILAPVVGNFTEEEANGNTVPQDTLEYPLQRDEVHTTNAKGDRNHQIPSGMLSSLSLFHNCFVSFFHSSLMLLLLLRSFVLCDFWAVHIDFAMTFLSSHNNLVAWCCFTLSRLFRVCFFSFFHLCGEHIFIVTFIINWFVATNCFVQHGFSIDSFLIFHIVQHKRFVIFYIDLYSNTNST